MGTNKLLSKPAEQRQGEPVACASIYVEQLDGHLVATVRRFDARMLPVGRLVNVYKYPADSGEVERLRAEVEQFKVANAQLSKANVDRRGRLAERDALLRHLYDHNELSLGDDQLILASLSASAEPSAPVERDERAAFDAWTARQGRVVGYLGWREDFAIWQAALDRKS